MKKIAVFIADYNIDYSASIINFLDYLSEHYQIDLYIKNIYFKRSKILRKKNIRIIEVCSTVSLKRLWQDWLCYGKEIVKFVIRKNSSLLLKIGKKLTVEKITKQISPLSYESFVCFEPHGLILCKELFPASSPIYYSLELYLRNDKPNPFYSAAVQAKIVRIMEAERQHIKDINGLIIQSREREHLFRKDYNLSETIRSMILPITCRGRSVAEKSNYLHKKFGIADNIKIALHLGGMNYWYSSIELALTFAKIENWLLVFQGNHLQEYLSDFKKILKINKISNVLVLNKFFDDINALDHLLMSATIGLAWYNDINTNFRSAGLSSGKITAYLKFGLPVIANRYPSTEEVLEKTGSGICVAKMDEIAFALSKINANYNFFSTNARQEYEHHYRFENYHQPLLRFLELEEQNHQP